MDLSNIRHVPWVFPKAQPIQILSLLFVILVSLFLGCAEDPDKLSGENETQQEILQNSDAGANPVHLVSYEVEIKPLVEKHCLGCHQQDGVSPTLLTYEQVRGSGSVDAVLSGRMPPSGTLVDLERNLLASWRNGGFLQYPASSEIEETVTESPIEQNSEDMPIEQMVPIPIPEQEGEVTYNDHIKPLLSLYRCVSCHGDQGTPPALTNYQQVRNSSSVDAVVSGRMPKGKAVTSIHRDLFLRWQRGGFIESGSGGAIGLEPSVVIEQPDTSRSDNVDTLPGQGITVTYLDHIKPLMEKYNCLVCHGEGGQSPLLTSYDLVKASSTVDSVVKGRMPSGASMGTEERQIFKTWAETGYTESLGTSMETSCIDALPPVGIRRLSKREFKNTLLLVSGVNLDGISFDHPSDPIKGGFANNKKGLVVTRPHLEFYMNAAQGVAAKMMTDSEHTQGCRNRNRNNCVDSVIQKFSELSYRRPVNGLEVTILRDKYDAIASEFGHVEGLKITLESILTSPNFLYRTELGSVSGMGVVELEDFEIANLMSYMLTGSPPDQLLVEDAAAGNLKQVEVRIAHSERLMATSAFIENSVAFVTQWLGLNKIGNTAKDENLYPSFNEALKSDFKKESEMFIREVYQQDSGPGELISGKYSFLNDNLISHYGLQGATREEGFRKVDWNGGERSGLLTQGSFTAIYSHPNSTSPILRGKVITSKVVCVDLPAPPADITPLEAAGSDPSLTTRELVALHSSDPACKGCHSIMDPLGFSLEGFNAVGQVQTREKGKPIDSAGFLKVQDREITFTDIGDLASQLANDKVFKDCFADQAVRFTIGSEEKQQQTCSTKNVIAEWQNSGGSIKELLKSIIKSTDFIKRVRSMEGN